MSDLEKFILYTITHEQKSGVYCIRKYKWFNWRKLTDNRNISDKFILDNIRLPWNKTILRKRFGKSGVIYAELINKLICHTNKKEAQLLAKKIAFNELSFDELVKYYKMIPEKYITSQLKLHITRIDEFCEIQNISMQELIKMEISAYLPLSYIQDNWRSIIIAIKNFHDKDQIEKSYREIPFFKNKNLNIDIVRKLPFVRDDIIKNMSIDFNDILNLTNMDKLDIITKALYENLNRDISVDTLTSMLKFIGDKITNKIEYNEYFICSVYKILDRYEYSKIHNETIIEFNNRIQNNERKESIQSMIYSYRRENITKFYNYMISAHCCNLSINEAIINIKHMVTCYGEKFIKYITEYNNIEKSMTTDECIEFYVKLRSKQWKRYLRQYNRCPHMLRRLIRHHGYVPRFITVDVFKEICNAELAQLIFYKVGRKYKKATANILGYFQIDTYYESSERKAHNKKINIKNLSISEVLNGIRNKGKKLRYMNSRVLSSQPCVTLNTIHDNKFKWSLLGICENPNVTYEFLTKPEVYKKINYKHCRAISSNLFKRDPRLKKGYKRTIRI